MRFYDKLFALQKALKIKNNAMARESGLDAAAVSRFFLGKRPLPAKYISTICDAAARLSPNGAPAEDLPPELHRWTGKAGQVAPAKLSQAMYAWLTDDIEQEEAIRKQEKQIRRKRNEKPRQPRAETRTYAKRELVSKDFSEKLSLLMDITGLSGSQLAGALHVDTTLIYKYRMGARLPSLKDNTVPIIADYIGMHIKDAEQREKIMEAAGRLPHEMNIAPEDIGLWIEGWLLEKKEEDTSPARSFLESLEQFSYFAMEAMLIPLEEIAALAGDVTKNESFWGIAGMRDAATRYLYYAATREQPVTLLICTTSSLDFLTEEPYWKAVWGSLMIHCLQKGHTIKIIYSMADRTTAETMDAIKAFVPLYMTGNMEPYTFKKSEGTMVRHTTYLIEGEVCVTAAYAEGLDDSAEFVYSTEPKRLEAQMKHFDALMAASTELMDIFRGEQDMDAFDVRLGRFWVRSGDATLLLPSLSFGTMPEPLLFDMLVRAGVPENARKNIVAAHTSAALRLRRQLNIGRLDELTMAASDARFDAGTVFVDIPTHLLPEPLAYTREEYASHLAHIRQLRQEWPGYNLHELDESPFHNIKVFHKNAEVIVQKIGNPAAVFAIENVYMCRGFAQFLAELKEG